LKKPKDPLEEHQLDPRRLETPDKEAVFKHQRIITSIKTNMLLGREVDEMGPWSSLNRIVEQLPSIG